MKPSRAQQAARKTAATAAISGDPLPTASAGEWGALCGGGGACDLRPTGRFVARTDQTLMPLPRLVPWIASIASSAIIFGRGEFLSTTLQKAAACKKQSVNSAQAPWPLWMGRVGHAIRRQRRWPTLRMSPGQNSEGRRFMRGSGKRRMEAEN